MQCALLWLDVFSFLYLTGTKMGLSEKTPAIGWRMPGPVICARFFLQHSAPELLLLFLLCIYPIMRKMSEVEQMINNTSSSPALRKLIIKGLQVISATLLPFCVSNCWASPNKEMLTASSLEKMLLSAGVCRGSCDLLKLQLGWWAQPCAELDPFSRKLGPAVPDVEAAPGVLSQSPPLQPASHCLHISM